MIPHIIHLCWFGKGKYPKLAERCIESWKKYLPNYKIMVWNEDSFNVDLCEYTKTAYREKNGHLLVIMYVYMHLKNTVEYIWIQILK